MQSNTMIEVRSEVLGVFLHELNLRSDPPPLEGVVKFKVELGERGTSYVRFKNTFTEPVEFTAKVSGMSIWGLRYLIFGMNLKTITFLYKE